MHKGRYEKSNNFIGVDDADDDVGNDDSNENDGEDDEDGRVKIRRRGLIETVGLYIALGLNVQEVCIATQIFI